MAKETPSPHEVRLALLDTNPVFQNLGMGGMGDLLACVAWVGLVMCLCS